MKRHIRSAFIVVAVFPVLLLLLQTSTRGAVAVITTEFSTMVAFALVICGGIGAYITQRMMTENEAYPFERKKMNPENEKGA